MKKCLFFLSFFFAISTQAQGLNWVTAYFSNWAAPGMPPEVFEWEGLTHLIHFNIEPSRTAPYYSFPQTQGMFEGGGWGATGDSYQRNLIAAAHAHGVKMILCIGGIGDVNQQNYAWIASDSVRCETAMASILGYAKSKGYDGVDFDIEGWASPTAAQFAFLSRVTRRQLDAWSPRGVLTIAGDREYSSSKPAWVINAYYDQINDMNYDDNGWWSTGSGFHAPLYNPSPNYAFYPSESGGLNTDHNITSYLNAGVLPSKLGLGVAFYGYHSTAATGPGQHWLSTGNTGVIWYNGVQNQYLDLGIGTRHYDTLAQQPWISFPGGYINYDDPQSIQAKMNYAKQRGLGGVMIFAYDHGYNNSKPVGQRHPLMKAVRENLTPPSPSVPAFLTQPANSSVLVGEQASFSVYANGYPAPTFQWQRNSVNISGATGPLYTTPATNLGDNGATFRCIASNSQGSAASATVTLSVTVPAIANPLSDDFSNTTRFNNLWRASHPSATGLVGLGTTDALLRLSLDGTPHEMGNGDYNSMRILQGITDGNFEVVAKFQSVPSSTYQWEGILVKQNATNYLRFDVLKDNGGLKFYAGVASSSNSQKILASINVSGQNVWVKVNRVGNVWTASYSSDGSTFVQTGQFSQSFVADSIGVYAGNQTGGSGAPAFDCTVDYFFNTGNPISPEDPVSGAPTGTFVSSNDTLAVGGGPVTLTWTSVGAVSASIDHGIGTVASNGSVTVTIGQTKSFTLTLTNSIGSQAYIAHIVVPLQSSGGAEDITAGGTPTALVTAPTGLGNKNLEIIRDGITPPVGSSNPAEQYDTFTGVGTRLVDWIGYTYTTTQTFGSLVFQEGIHAANGGFFSGNPRVEIRVGGQWIEAQLLQITPPYNAAAASFTTYTLRFNAMSGDAIRVTGVPGGTDKYVSVAELRVLTASPSSVGTSDTKPKNLDLLANYPNPFNPSTTIEFLMPATAQVTLAVYNILGQKVVTLVDRVMEQGRWPITWNGRDQYDRPVSSGVYLYKMQSGNFVATRKMIFSK